MWRLQHFIRASVSAVLVGALQLTTSGATSPALAEAAVKIPPAQVEPVAGTQLKRIKLDSKAVQRLDVQTAEVRQEPSGKKIIPYASVIYDLKGAWVYTNPEPLTYLRHSVTVELIRGDELGYSDALLGAFAAITVPAAAALAALDQGDLAGYDAAMNPTVPLSRLIFEPPTFDYKVGVAFLAWLNGLQPHFAMLGGLHHSRPAGHLIRVFELAAGARALAGPDLAAERMTEFLGKVT